MSVAIGNLLSEIIPKKDRWKIELLQRWPSIIGSLSDKVRIESIYKDQLILGVTHPAWAQELFLMTHVIKRKVNEALKAEHIKEIRFRSVVFDREKKNIADQRERYVTLQKQFNELPSVSLTNSEEQKLSEVENEELRKVLELFYLRCKKQRINRGVKNGKKC